MCSSILSRFQSRLLIALLAGLLSLTAVLPLHAEFIDGEQKLLAADGDTDDQFGYSVSVSGNYAVVGSSGDDDKGENSGAAYVFKRNPNGSWSQQAKLTANDGAAKDGFGYSVSISGDYVIIGADDDDKGETSGAAYIFKRNLDESWVQQAKLTAGDGAEDDYFGCSVSISGDYAIVGAYDDNNEKGADAGSAYIFRRNSDGSWTEQAKLTADDGEVGGFEFGEFVSISGDYTIVSGGYAVYIFKRKDGLWIQQKKLTPDDGCFGEVSISGDYAIVGDPYKNDERGEYSGAAYIFRRNSDESWTQQAKLISDDGAAYDYFGNAVSLSGDYAVVGAWQHDDKGKNSGAVYIFRRNPDGSWIQQKKLTSDDGAEGDGFGVSVSVSGDNIFVGANGDDDTLKGTDSGSVYVYDARMAYKITPGDGAADDNFGNAVAISGDYAIIGAYWDDNSGLEDSGAAYIYRRNADGSWIQQQKLFASDADEVDYFGSSVAISGDYAIVGAPEDDDRELEDSGAAYIFKRNTEGSWTEKAKLMPKKSDSDDSDYFGYSVSISGDYAVIGASGEDSDSESVYIFKRNTDGSWTQQPNLSATGRTEYDDDFGYSVSMSGDYVIVGAPGDGEGWYGAAYIFRRNSDGSWVQQEKLVATDRDGWESFGASVSISGDYILIGASGDSDDLGAAYIFKRNSDGKWTQQTKFVANDSEFYDGYFGCSVTISGDYAVVGAYEDDDKGDDSGSAYVFRRNPDGSWVQHTKLFAKDSAKEDYFGCSVAISGDYVLAGACWDDDKGLDSGSAYFFKAPFQSSSVTVTVNGKGNVSPDGFFSLGSAPQEFTITPDSHYQIKNVLVDGKVISRVPNYMTYTFSDILTDHTLEAIFEIDNDKPCSQPVSPVSVNAEKNPFEITYIANDIYEGDECGKMSLGNGLTKVELYVKVPRSEQYVLADTDTGNSIDGKFSYSAKDEGLYSFYTRATDNAGNTENVPEKGYDTQTIYAPEFSGYAIIAVGSIGTNEGIQDHTLAANNIYTHLINRGFALVEENREADPLDYIKYFNPYDTPQPGEDDYTEHDSYKDALKNALTEWAPKKMKAISGPLFLIMINHGSPDTFYLTGEQTLTAEELKEWLANLEDTMKKENIEWKNPKTGEKDTPPIVVILGACYSGSFIDDISAPGRIIVTASTEKERSYRGTSNPYSGLRDGEFFTSALFNGLGAGLSLKASFEEAVGQTSIHTDSGKGINNNDPRQHPLLNDNEDGEGSNNNLSFLGGKDGAKSEHIFLGRDIGVAESVKLTDAGTVPDMEDTQSPNFQPLSFSKNDAILWARVNENESTSGKSKVWAGIREPGLIIEQQGVNQQTVELKSVELEWNAAESRYQATYKGFEKPGIYTLFFYAKGGNGIVSSFGYSSLERIFLYKKKSDGEGESKREAVTVYGDVNRDGKIGIEEAIYILRELAE